MGAAAAAIAAVHARRIRDILDAYRVSGATSAGAARAPQELGLDDHERELEELEGAGVLRSGAVAGTFYLVETEYISWRDRARGRRKVALILGIVALFIAMAMGLWATSAAVHR